MAELLDPGFESLDADFSADFRGMVDESVELSDLVKIQRELTCLLRNIVTGPEKEFLLSFKSGRPEWNKLELGDLSHLPGIQWKLLNLRKMKPDRHRLAVAKLEKVLSS